MYAKPTFCTFLYRVQQYILVLVMKIVNTLRLPRTMQSTFRLGIIVECPRLIKRTRLGQRPLKMSLKPPQGAPIVRLLILSIPIFLIPLYAVFQLHCYSTKYVESTSYRQIDPALAQTLDLLKITETPASSSICHGNRAPTCKTSNQGFIDARLQALDIRCMDQEF